LGKGKCRGFLPVGEKERNLGCLRARRFATVRASMRRLPSLLAAALLALACASPPPPPAPAEPVRPFDAERAWEDLESLAAIGPRPSGSEGAARARSHLRSQLEALGLEVHTWRPASDPDNGAPSLPGGPPTEGASPAGTDGSPPTGASRAAPREASVEEALGGGEEREANEDPPSAAVGKGPDSEITHLVGVIPGELDPVVVLATRYDSAPEAGPAANAAASGPALVLELARALAADPLPYTTCVVFLDGGADGREGVRLWANALREQGMLDRIRLALVLHRVADGEAPIVRDLFSRRPYREVFWEAAERWDTEQAFPADLDFAPAQAPHTALLDVGLRRVVALAGSAPASAPPAPAAPEAGDAGGGDPTAGDTEETGSAGQDAGAATGTGEHEIAAGEGPEEAGPAPVAPPEDTVDRASRERLGAVGLVALEGLDVLTRRLAKVDRLLPPPEPVEARATSGAGIGPDADPALP